MDLKSGCLFWPQIAKTRLHFDPLSCDCCCDVAIVGGGITGALAAYHMVEAGVDVIVVDRRQPACGSTAASTGLLQYEIDTTLCELIGRIGLNRAQRAYRISLQSLIDFESLVAKLPDRCGFVARPSLYLGAHRSDARLLDEECEQRRRIGIEVEYIGKDELHRSFGFNRPAALWSHRGAEVDPYRLTQNLHRRASQLGARIFGDTEIHEYTADDAGVTLASAHGPRIRARRIIFATGYETPEFVDRDLCQLHSTYAMAGAPVPPIAQWPQRCLIWEHDDPYFYGRQTDDGRVLIGGEDISSSDAGTRDALIVKKSRRLIKRFAKLFPGVEITPACCWAGTFAQTKDGLPYIGELPEFPHGYFALGYGGNGITFSLVAAQIIRDVFLQRSHPDAELFAFGR